MTEPTLSIRYECDWADGHVAIEDCEIADCTTERELSERVQALVDDHVQTNVCAIVEPTVEIIDRWRALRVGKL